MHVERGYLSSVVLVLLATGLTGTETPKAQATGTTTIRVVETSGIRRTEFPVRAAIRIPSGTVAAPVRMQLQQADAPVPAQFTTTSTWPDGSPQTIDVDFNVTLNPGESRTYRVLFGSTEMAAPAVARGLSVVETDQLLRVGGTAFHAAGSPLIPEATYVRSQFIGQFDGARNTFAIVDKAGVRHELSQAESLKFETIKRGPLVALLRYSGDMPLDAGASAAFVVLVEMPSSKSWVKVSATVSDPRGRIRDLQLDTPLAVGALPWTWDFGTENGTYGSIRTANDAVVFTQIAGSPQDRSWKVETGSAAALRPYETSRVVNNTPPPLSAGWGALVGASTAVAFGIDAFGQASGVYSVSLTGQGQATYRFSPSGTGTTHRFGVYQHFVSTPVPIGAATTPHSMLHPPVVTIE